MENHVVELVQPRHTLIGENSILEIPQFLHRLEGTVTALVVTDQGLVKIGTVKKVAPGGRSVPQGLDLQRGALRGGSENLG